MTSSRKARARRGDGEKLRAEILDATERLLVELRDADAVSIRAVATAVGKTPPAIYLHFTDKDELIRAVCARRFEDLNRTLETAGARNDDPLESLRLRGESYIRFGVAHPDHYRVLMLAVRPRSEDVAAADVPGMTAFQHLVAAVQRCIDAKLFHESDSVKIALTLWSALHGITALLITLPQFELVAGGTDGIENVIQLMLDVQMEGLLAV